MKENRVSVNEREAWGQLHYDREFDACIGARFADNRQRDFGIFGDRITIVGEETVANVLKKWLFGRKIINTIKRNTSFVFGTDACHWLGNFDIGKGGCINVILDVQCRGEYCYVAAYARRYPSGRVRVIRAMDEFSRPCWKAVMDDRPELHSPVIYASTKIKAMDVFLDWIANHFEVAGPLWEGL